MNKKENLYVCFYKKIYRFLMNHIRAYKLFKWLYRLLPLTAVLMYGLLIFFNITSKNIYDTLRVILVPVSAFLIVTLLRKKIDAKRPYTQYNITPIIKKEKEGESMPSRHVVSYTIIAMSWLYYNKYVGIVLLVFAFFMAIVRFIAGVHFLRDVTVGYVIGVLFGYIGYFLFVTLFCLTMVHTDYVYADDTYNEEKIVRVGYVIADGYQEGLDGEYKTGYGYEYLQKISYYTGWKYEYVYGTFTELINKLSNGQIDLMGNLSYTAERAEKFNYAREEQGTEEYFLYIRSSQLDDYNQSLSDLNGKVIGVSANTFQEMLLKKWCEDNNLDCEIRPFLSTENRLSAMNNHEIDAVTAGNLTNKYDLNENWEALYKIGSSAFYFGINKDRDDILEELNKAQLRILMTDRLFNYEVHSRYQTYDNINSDLLTNQEIDDIKDKEFKIGYMKNYLPLCSTNEQDNQLTGLASKVLSLIKQKYKDINISFQAIEYDDYDTMLIDLKNEKLDIIFPVYGDFWLSEQENISLSNEINTTSMTLLYEGGYKDDLTSKIAVVKSSPFQKYFAKIYYPNSQIIEFPNMQDCVNALEDGKATCILYNTNCYQVEKDNYKQLTQLNKVNLSQKINITFGFRKDSYIFLSAFNKGLDSIDQSVINDSLIEYSNIEKDYTISDYIYNHLFTSIMIILITITAIILIFTSYVILSLKNQNKLKAINIELEQKNNELNMHKYALKQAYESAVSSSNTKTEFMSKMSHDIRTPLNSIIGMTILAEENSKDPDILHSYLEKINNSGHHLLSLINDLLDMNRIESGKLKLTEEIFNISTCIDNILTIIRPQTIIKNQTLDINFASLKHIFVRGDMTRLQQILINILNNSVKYTPENGTIKFSVIEKKSYKNNNRLYEFIIEDNGIGISPEFMPHIYEPFAREHDSRVSQTEGTGLGLAIVYNIVQLMNGTIQIDSIPSKGTKTSVFLPFIFPENENDDLYNNNSKTIKSGIEELKNSSYSDKCVLLVEDRENNRIVAAEILKLTGLKVEMAENGKEAVEIIKKMTSAQFNLIFMDIQMPEMNGYEAAKAIRSLENEAAKNIPIIAMTANVFKEDIINCRNAGMNDYLAKPLDIDKILAILKKWL